MTVSRGHIAGNYHAQICKRSQTGYPMGTAADPDNVANGTILSAYRLLGPVSAGALNPTITVADFFGGGKPLGSMDLGVSGFGAFELVLSAHDDTFHTIINGSQPDTAIASAYSVTAPNVAGIPPQLFLMLTGGYQKEDGSNWFIHYIYNNVQIRRGSIASLSGNGGTNSNPNTYTVRPSLATRTIFGYLYEDTDLNVVDNSDVMTEYKTQYPITVVTLVGNGTIGASGTPLQLPYLPITSDATGAATNVITKDGVLQAASSVTPASGEVVFASAPANATNTVLVPTTRFVPAA